MSMKSIKNLGAWARFGGPVPPTGPSLKPLLVLIMHCVTVVISVFIALANLIKLIVFLTFIQLFGYVAASV